MAQIPHLFSDLRQIFSDLCQSYEESETCRKQDLCQRSQFASIQEAMEAAFTLNQLLALASRRRYSA